MTKNSSSTWKNTSIYLFLKFSFVYPLLFQRRHLKLYTSANCVFYLTFCVLWGAVDMRASYYEALVYGESRDVTFLRFPLKVICWVYKHPIWPQKPIFIGKNESRAFFGQIWTHFLLNRKIAIFNDFWGLGG